MVAGRAKTDKLDAKLLAKLLRADLIPTAYVPPRSYADLRGVTRARARLTAVGTVAAAIPRGGVASRDLTPFLCFGRPRARCLKYGPRLSE
ncbi:MAG: transposase [Candidatus Binatia bacterium]